MQSKLLRVLQEGEFERVGKERTSVKGGAKLDHRGGGKLDH